MDKVRLTLIFMLLNVMTDKYQQTNALENITVAYITERSYITDMPFIINRTIGLIDIAMAKAQEIVKDVAHLDFIVRYADVPACTPFKFGALAAEIYHTTEIQAILGPGCSNAVEPVARLTASWNLPHITYGGTNEMFGNKTEFSTLTRLAYTMNEFAKFYMTVFEAFSWTDIAIVYDDSQFLGKLVGNNLQRSFQDSSLTSSRLPFKSNVPDLNGELVRVLYEAKKISRVLCVSCNGTVLRQIALQARKIGMTPEEYTIIYFVSDPSSDYIGYYGWETGDEFDMEAKKSYESLLVVQPRRPVSKVFLELEQTVMKVAKEKYNYTWAEGSELGIFHFGQYDSFILYAYALKDSLEQGKDRLDVRNATLFMNRLWNRTFTGIGGPVFVNGHGDRDTDFSLLDLDPITGQFRAVAEYLGYTRTFGMLPSVSIHWPNNDGPTPNRPVCGFSGESCLSSEFPLYGTVTIVFVGVIVFLVVVGIVFFRHTAREAAIQSQWWRVNWDEVNIQTNSVLLSTRSKVFEDTSSSRAANTNARKSVGIYKSVRVYIRKSTLQTFSVDRRLQMELKEMRDISSANLTRLIGICPEPGNVCILTEYCSRGSLQDILHNDGMQLDEDFRISLIKDIVQGMHYIHTSPISVHGKLSSSSCVIDSRFVLKVTDYGLRCIIDHEYSEPNPAILHDAFWIAPEVLRVFPPRLYSQPGDIYSFGIILYEMCTRHEPYVNESWYKSKEDTIQQLKTERTDPLRPSFGETQADHEIVELAFECWSETPEKRPKFSEIRKKLHNIRRDKSYSDNVLDMLLQRMEKYANNLEEIVEEKTNAFLEEKKKSEELLYAVLPKSIVDELRLGRPVTPEAFDNVTIYFSDIVGFTTISASSTPFQVVDLLNDVYTCFDEVIGNFDVYKVETIGDAYMVVSGLPVSNGEEHVRQIARLSLKILEKLKYFKVRHRPETTVQARIGMHSGPVVAGVVGRKMPRYCLFGDTVNTASRMESNGLPMMIHVSDSSKRLLDKLGNFYLEERGAIEIKGKGVMVTYWLIDELMVNR